MASPEPEAFPPPQESPAFGFGRVVTSPEPVAFPPPQESPVIGFGRVVTSPEPEVFASSQESLVVGVGSATASPEPEAFLSSPGGPPRPRTLRRRPRSPDSGRFASTHPFGFTSPDGAKCVVTHNGVPQLFAWARVIGPMFDTSDEKWARAGDLFNLTKPQTRFRCEQKMVLRTKKKITSVAWEEAPPTATSQGGITMTVEQLRRFAAKSRQIGRSEMKEIAEWQADAAAAAQPVSRNAAAASASRANHLRTSSDFPRRNLTRTLELRAMNVTGGPDYLTGAPSLRDRRMRSRLHTIGKGRFTPEQCVHLSYIKGDDAISIEVALRDVLVGVAEPMSIKVQRVGDHFVAAVGFTDMVERDQAAAVYKACTIAKDDPGDSDKSNASDDSDDGVFGSEPGSDDSDFHVDEQKHDAALPESDRECSSSLDLGESDQDDSSNSASQDEEPVDYSAWQGCSDVKLQGRVTARPPTIVCVADFVSIFTAIPKLLIDASATRGSLMQSRADKKMRIWSPTFHAEFEAEHGATAVPHFDVGLIYFIDAAQGMTQVQIWLASRELYPGTGVSRPIAVITGSGKEKAIVHHAYLQLFLGELVDLTQNTHQIKFMFRGRPATASVRVVGPSSDHYAGFVMNGVLGGTSRARAQQDMSDGLMFGVKADQGLTDVTLGGVERMRVGYREYMARQAEFYRQREMDNLEQSAFTAQMLAAADVGSRIHKKMKLWSPTFRAEFKDFIVAPASLHCLNELGINVLQFGKDMLPPKSPVLCAIGELIFGEREAVVEATLGDGKCVQNGAMMRRLVSNHAWEYFTEASAHLRDADHRVCALLPILTARLQASIYTDRASKGVLELLVTSRLVFVLTAWLSATVGGKGKPSEFGKAEWHSGIKWHTGNLYYHTMATVMWRTKLKLMALGFDLAQHIDEWGEMHLVKHVLHAATLHQKCSIIGERELAIIEEQSEPYVPTRKVRSGYNEISVELPHHDIIICRCMFYTHPKVQPPAKHESKKPAGPEGKFNRRGDGSRELPIASTELRDLFRKIPSGDAHDVWCLRSSAMLIGVGETQSRLRYCVEKGDYPDSDYLANPGDLLVVCACGNHSLQPCVGITRDFRLSAIRESYFNVRPDRSAPVPTANRYPMEISHTQRRQVEVRVRLLEARRVYQRWRLIRTRGPTSPTGLRHNVARLRGLEEVCDDIKTKKNTKHTRFRLLQCHLKLERACVTRGLPAPQPIPRAWWLRAPRRVRDAIRARRPMVDRGFCSHHSCVNLVCKGCVCVRARRECGPRCHKAAEGRCGNKFGCGGVAGGAV